MNEQQMINEIGGKAVAEIAIEAWRDAEESGYQLRLNPYEKGTYASIEYLNACQKRWATQLKTVNGN